MQLYVLDSIIKRETNNFYYISSTVTNSIKDTNIYIITLQIIFCILTDNHIKQSLDRLAGKKDNKGIEAAILAIKMVKF